MEYVLFPRGFFDSPRVSDLSSDHKLVAAYSIAHPMVSPAAVLSATPYILGQVPLPQDVFWGVVADLECRDSVVVDLATREIFVSQSFQWHRAPAPEDNTPWARQVRTAVSRIQSRKVKDAVLEALAAPPEARITALKIPTNLLTAMPLRGMGLGWTAAETLVHFGIAMDPAQTPAGVYRPALPSLAAFCSLPLGTLLECIDSLAAVGGIYFDRSTGELFSPARLRAAQNRDLKKVREAAADVVSRPIFKAFEKAAKRIFPTIRFESTNCFLEQESGANYRKGECSVPAAPVHNLEVVKGQLKAAPPEEEIRKKTMEKMNKRSKLNDQ